MKQVTLNKKRCKGDKWKVRKQELKEGREDKSELENSNERGEDRIKEEGKRQLRIRKEC